MWFLVILLLAWGGIFNSSMYAPHLSQRGDLLSLGEGGECWSITNSHRSWSDVFGMDHDTNTYVAYCHAAVGTSYTNFK